MRLLHIADVHLQRSFKWLGPERGRRRRQGQQETLRRVIDLAHDRQVDALCIAGDLFEIENAAPALGEALRATFAAYPDLPTLIAPGNHDYLRPGCLYETVDWPSHVHIFREERPMPFSVADGTVWGSAFRGPERHDSPLDGFRAPADGLHLGLFHADVVEGSVGSPYGPLDPTAIGEAGLRFAMLGHIHAGKVDQRHAFAYPGSLEPLDLSETGPRWALLIEASHSDLKIEPIPVARREIRSEILDVSTVSTRAELNQTIARRWSEWEHADLRLRVVGTLRGDLVDPVHFTEALTGLDVDLSIEARPEEDLETLARQQTTLGAFVREMRARIVHSVDGNSAHWEEVLRVGLAAFRGEEAVLG